MLRRSASNCLCFCRGFQKSKNSCSPRHGRNSGAVRTVHSVVRGRSHHPHVLSNRTTQHRTVRWYNQESGGKGGDRAKPPGGDKGKPPEGEGGNFFQKFFANVRKEMKGGEVQESLKGFNEEREEMQQSYVVQQAILKWKAMMKAFGTASSKSSEKAGKGWSVLRKTSSKAIKDVSETEIGKKGHAIGSQFAQGVQKTAEEVVKTDVGQAVKKGSEVVKEDLLDDIIKESSPYKSPEKIMSRSEMASDFSKPETKTFKPNDDAKEVVVTKQSKWKQQWKEWKENNPISNAAYNIKTRYDESDNILIRATRVVTDKVEEVVSGAMTQTDMAETLGEIHKIDPTFNKEEFVQQCKYEIIPSVLESFMQGNKQVLKDWCHETAFSILSAIMEQRHKPGVKVRCKVLEVRNIDILMAKMMEQGPVLVLHFEAQQLTQNDDADDVGGELLENVTYIWALCRDQTIYDPKTAWRVLEFGIQSAGKMLV